MLTFSRTDMVGRLERGSLSEEYAFDVVHSCLLFFLYPSLYPILGKQFVKWQFRRVLNKTNVTRLMGVLFAGFKGKISTSSIECLDNFKKILLIPKIQIVGSD